MNKTISLRLWQGIMTIDQIVLKPEQIGFFPVFSNVVMLPKDAEGMANSVDSGQTAPWRAV